MIGFNSKPMVRKLRTSCFEPGDRVKKTVVETDPLRYIAIYGTVLEHSDPTASVRWDDGKVSNCETHSIHQIDDDLERPEPIAYQNPDRSKWGRQNVNQWSERPFA